MAERKSFAQFTGYDCFQPVMFSIVFFYGLFTTFTDYVVCRFICFSSDVASTIFLSLINLSVSVVFPQAHPLGCINEGLCSSHHILRNDIHEFSICL